MDNLSIKSMDSIPLLVLAAHKREVEALKVLINIYPANGFIAEYKQALYHAKNWATVKVLLDAKPANLAYKKSDKSKGNALIDNPCLTSFIVELVSAVNRGEYKVSFTPADYEKMVEKCLMDNYMDAQDLVLFCQEMLKLGVDISLLFTKITDNLSCGEGAVATIDFLLTQISMKELFDRFEESIEDYASEKDDGIEDYDAYCATLKRLLEMGYRPSVPHHNNLVTLLEMTQLYDLLYSYNLPISVNHLIMVVNYAVDEAKGGVSEGENEALYLTEHLVKLGVSVIEKDEHGKSALLLALNSGYQPLMDVLVHHGYNQARWKGDFKLRFSKFEDYLNNNLDFSSLALNDMAAAHPGDGAQTMAEFKDEHPIQSVTKCPVVKKLKDTAVECMPNW